MKKRNGTCNSRQILRRTSMAFCEGCGAPMNPGVTVCATCGKAVQSPAYPSTMKPIHISNPGVPISSAEAHGFLSSLFDLSFTSFVTVKLIKMLFVLSILFAGLEALAIAGFGLTAGGPGILLVLLAPVVFLLLVTWS